VIKNDKREAQICSVIGYLGHYRPRESKQTGRSDTQVSNEDVETVGRSTRSGVHQGEQKDTDQLDVGTGDVLLTINSTVKEV